jgi:uncharacterized protein (DUF488 family)
MCAIELYTVGHSTRALDEFVELLRHYQIRNLIDIRRFPISAKYPHFRKEMLESAAARSGIAYYWLGDSLGGYRKGGYEAYMASEEFKQGIEAVIGIAAGGRTALMCAELLWFRCHRRFVAEALVKKGWEVLHIFDMKRVVQHRLKQ